MVRCTRLDREERSDAGTLRGFEPGVCSPVSPGPALYAEPACSPLDTIGFAVLVYAHPALGPFGTGSPAVLVRS